MRISSAPYPVIEPYVRPSLSSGARAGIDPAMASTVLAATAGYSPLGLAAPALPLRFALPTLTMPANQAEQLISGYQAGMTLVGTATRPQLDEAALLNDAGKLEDIARNLIAPPHGHVPALVYLLGICGGLAAQAAGARFRRPVVQRLGKTTYDAASFAGGFLRHDAQGVEALLAGAGLLSDVLEIPAPDFARSVTQPIDLVDRFVAQSDTLAETIRLASLQLELDESLHSDA